MHLSQARQTRVLSATALGLALWVPVLAALRMAGLL